MANFVNKFDNIFYKELKVKHLKIIYKALLGDNPDPEVVFCNFNNIITSLTNLSNKDIDSLNFINYFLLLLEFRITSIGNIVFSQLSDGVTKVEFNLTKIKKQLENLNNKYQKQKITLDDFTLIYNLPTIKEILYINKLKNIEDLYICFIDQIIFKNTIIDFKLLSIEEKNAIFETLPAKLSFKLIQITTDCLKYFNTINLISYITQLKDVTLTFNFNINNLLLFLKFIFGDNLLSLYENIFALCKLGNFTPKYIENCTPGEYLLLIKKLEQINSQTNKQAPQTNIDNFNDGLENTDSFEYPDLPPIHSQANYGSL
jgi:hypothetical protein